VSGTLAAAIARDIPVFGVCLGLQGMVEHFGGELGILHYPMHGKASRVRNLGGRVLTGLPDEFTAGRYHSLYALPEHMPADLRVTAVSDDGIIMAVEHADLPIAAVQFHPESILSLDGDYGLRLIENVVARLARRTTSVEPSDDSLAIVLE
jgi:anthranilate synthase